MKFLAIIPARGGSKRIERKNIKEFCGKPVIAYSIEAAIRSGCFDEVMVSTDDVEIAEVARSYGASVPFMRSADTSNDFATTADVIREVVSSYASIGRKFDAIACIYATAPFVTPERLREGASILEEGRAEAAFTCVEYSYPVQRSLAIAPNGRIHMRYPEFATTRSQDLPKTYHDAGQFYFTTLCAFTECGSLWGPDTLPIVLPEMEVQDLDTLQDWELAELKFRMLLPHSFENGGYRFVSYAALGEEDSERMRSGRNEEEVRRQSVNQEEISPDAHKAFVEGLRQRNDCRYYAVYDGQGLIGSVNIHLMGNGRAERGIWLLAEHRGNGLSRKVCEALYGRLKESGSVKTILTEVRLGNDASNRLESSLGATEVSRDQEYIRYELPL